ncbi:MAG: M67 family metallopeptidase [Microthrixaceae bacterium]|nr:M67 family metallopeptidase [Microthrixaceae bacterium]
MASATFAQVRSLRSLLALRYLGADGLQLGILLVVLQLSADAYFSMVAHALDGLPDEACGLMVGHLGDDAAPASCDTFEPCENVAASSRIYSIGPRDLMRIERAADDADLDIVGVMHSHTHTEPYPSVTDVEQAPDPAWHYVIVSLRDEAPMLRSYRIVDGGITEEPVVVSG